MGPSFCTLEEAWGDQIEEKSPITRVESVIDPVQKEKSFENLTPQINFNTPFKKGDNSSIVKQCDICNLVLEQLKHCPDCLNKFRKMLIPALKNENKEEKKNNDTKLKINKKNRKNVEKKKVIEESDDEESDDDTDNEETSSDLTKKSTNSNTERIIIYVLIFILIILLIFEIYMSFRRKTSITSSNSYMPVNPYYGQTAGMFHL